MIFIPFGDLSKIIRSIFPSPKPLVNYHQHNNKKILKGLGMLFGDYTSFLQIHNESLTNLTVTT